MATSAIRTKRLVRLQLLGKVKSLTTVKARYATCTSAIIPLLIYSCPIQSTFTKAQLYSFSSIDRRAKAMLPNESQPTNIHNYLKSKYVDLLMHNVPKWSDTL